MPVFAPREIQCVSDELCNNVQHSCVYSPVIRVMILVDMLTARKIIASDLVYRGRLFIPIEDF